MIYTRRATACVAALMLIVVSPALGTSIREYNRFSAEQRAVFVSGAVSALAYYFGATGDQAKSKCVMDWWFGKPGEDTPGPRQIAIELALAERRDADGLEVEGVVLATIQKACEDKKPHTDLKRE